MLASSRLLALEALTRLEERDKAIAAQWLRRIERARYDADLAERRYEAVDPGNRLKDCPGCGGGNPDADL